MIAPVQGKVGQTITVEGYADDYGNHIVALEFSLDNGKSWMRQDTSSSNPDLMIHWTYSFVPQKPGRFKLHARSVSGDGRTSPLDATVDIFVD